MPLAYYSKRFITTVWFEPVNKLDRFAWFIDLKQPSFEAFANKMKWCKLRPEWREELRILQIDFSCSNFQKKWIQSFPLSRSIETGPRKLHRQNHHFVFQCSTTRGSVFSCRSLPDPDRSSKRDRFCVGSEYFRSRKSIFLSHFLHSSSFLHFRIFPNKGFLLWQRFECL